MFIRHILTAALLAISISCYDNRLTVCPADLIKGLAPADTTIAPGDQFNLRVALLGCAGTETLVDSLTWTSSDPNVVVVGLRTGTVIAVRGGVATVTVSGKTYRLIGMSRITVRQASPVRLDHDHAS